MAGEVGRRSAAADREQSVEDLAVEQLIVPRNNTVFARVMPALLGRAMATIGITCERMKLGGARWLPMRLSKRTWS